MKKLPVRLAAVLAWLAGLALLAWIFSRIDVAAVLAAVGEIGFWGIAFVVAYHLVPLLFDVVGWRLVFARPRPRLAGLAWARWIGEAGNSLLPGQAGELLRVRAAVLIGTPGTQAASAAVVDVTLGVIAQILFSLLGLALFAGQAGIEGAILWLVAGIVALIAGIAGFVVVQRRGMFGALAPLISRWVAHAPTLAGSVDQGVRAAWQRPREIGAAALWRFASCLVGAGEVWLVFYLLGAEVSLAEAIALESLGQAARAAAFIVPSGLGVQESALVFLSAALGIPAESALALALIKRVRELSLGLPAILSWQAMELRGRRSVASPSPARGRGD
jgi:putative membrane protein